jgi:type IX secretion system PorP/SprF family membrane protein
MNSFFKPYRYLPLRRSIFIYILLTVIGFPELNAQETQYSLFEYSPLYLNPANTGNYKGNWRASLIYRNQWAAGANAFTTTTAGFDAKFRLFRQKLAAGLFVLNDESGIGGLNYNKIYGSIAIEKEFAKNIFSLALQAGFVSGKINSWMVWDPVTRDYTAPNGEANFGESVSYPDIVVGVLWKRQIGILEPEAGISLAHLNSPKNSFFGSGEEKESIRLNLNGRVKLKLSDELFLMPAILYSGKNSVSLTQAGTDIGFRFLGTSSVKQVFAGVYLRNGIIESMEALSLRAGTTVGRMDIAFNYDIAMSDLSKSGNMGAFEIAVVYRSTGLVLNSYSIPCERY